MKYLIYKKLSAEKEAIKRMLSRISEDKVIDRMSLESRLETVEDELSALGAAPKAPFNAKLTFKGKPVVGSHGIFAEFGGSAVNKFVDMVASLVAAKTSPLSPAGPIPNRDQCQFLITGTAIGSFGFEMEHYLAQQEHDFGNSTPIEEAFEQARDILESALHSDDDLAESITNTDPRAIKFVREFLKTMVDADAYFSLEYGEHSFRFDNIEQVRSSHQRLKEENVQEEEVEFNGIFEGVLPNRRQFEFRILPEDKIFVGKVGPDIPDANILNRILKKTLTIKVRVTRIGKGRPQYVLLEAPLGSNDMESKNLGE